MHMTENILTAIAGVRSNKTRSLLTMLGIIIGISSVIIILTVSDALKATVMGALASSGGVSVSIGVTQKGDYNDEDFVWKSPEDKDLITEDMLTATAEHFRNEVTGVAVTEDLGSGTLTPGYGKKKSQVNVKGNNAAAMSMESPELVSGRWITETEYMKARKVAVISDKAAEALFGTTEGLSGKEVEVYVNEKYYTLTVVGVYKYEAAQLFGMSLSGKNTEMYIPYRTARAFSHSTKGFNRVSFMVELDDSPTVSELNDLMNRMKEYMNTHYYASNDSFEVDGSNSLASNQSLSNIFNMVGVGMAFIAAISLLVGGIGVMNIMLVSVSERTKEIGTRKALGATNTAIRMQFITESAIICMIGGAIGILLGSIGGYAASYVMKSPQLPSMFAILGAVGFSASIGIFFGYYPANKAAIMNPIDALRYE